MQINRFRVEKLAVEIHKLSDGAFRLAGASSEGNRQRYTLRPGPVMYYGKRASREAAAFLVGALVTLTGPDGQLSEHAEVVRAELFRVPEDEISQAFELGRRTAERLALAKATA